MLQLLLQDGGCPFDQIPHLVCWIGIEQALRICLHLLVRCVRNHHQVVIAGFTRFIHLESGPNLPAQAQAFVTIQGVLTIDGNVMGIEFNFKMRVYSRLSADNNIKATSRDDRMRYIIVNGAKLAVEITTDGAVGGDSSVHFLGGLLLHSIGRHYVD